MPNVTSYDQVGKAEDISGIISNISPTKSPFQTMIGSENINNTLHQWQEDALDPPALNAAIQGANAPASNFTPTLMRNNNTQILTKTAGVAGTTDKVKTYGRAKELSYQLAKKAAEIKRDLEYAFVGAKQLAVVGDNVSTASQMASAQTMIDATMQFNADGTAYSSGFTPAALTETAIVNANQALYIAGGEADTLMIKPADSLRVAAFAAATGRTRYLDGNTKTITNVVNVYVSPFGEQKVVINRWQRTSDAFLMEAANWKKLVLRNWFRIALAKVGDSTQVQMVGEFSLKHKNFKASALVTNLT